MCITRISTAFALLLTGAISLAQTTLPRSTPEAEGVSSRAILEFLDAAASGPHEFHSIMVVRHGKVVAEGWWNPYRADLKHMMYSVSKSWTATAIGLAAAEKRLTVEDPVVSFFPEYAPSNPGPYLAGLKVKHLLSMTVGQRPDPTGEVGRHDNWVQAFFNIPVLDEPGTKFLYNSAATYMLSAIVQKVTGQKLVDYLKSRLFDPLGITGVDSEVDPNGINTGGWGLRLKTEDMAKFGQLYLQKGAWGGKQILPSAWVEEATTSKILQNPSAPQSRRDSSDWLQGYCYQMWRSRHNSYRGDGAYGQYILVLPELDAVIAITSETADMQAELNVVWNYLLPAFEPGRLPADPKKLKELKSRLATLALPIPSGTPNPSLEAKLTGKQYALVSTDRRLESFGFEFKSGICHLTFNTDSVVHTLDFGSGRWVSGETTKFGPALTARQKANRVGLPPFKVEGSYRWSDATRLELLLRYIETPHCETYRFNISDPYITFEVENSIARSAAKYAYKAIEKVARANAPRLIIRGDDMGFSHSADQALIKSYREGIETSIEVIVPSPWFPETVRLLKENPRIDVGLHFAITSEWDNVKWRPLTEVPSLENPDGYFYPMLFPNKNYPGQSVMDKPWKIEDIEKELRAQIEMARKHIPRLSHVSGHMGSTMFNQDVRSMAEKVSKEYNLPFVDLGPGTWGIQYIWADLRSKDREQRVDTFIEMLGKLEDGKTYVFVEHPGLDDEEMRAIYHLGYEDVATHRQDVTAIFTSERVKEAIVRQGIHLVSYDDVFKK